MKERNRQAPKANRSNDDTARQSSTTRAARAAIVEAKAPPVRWPILYLNTPFNTVPDKLNKIDVAHILALEFVKHRAVFLKRLREINSQSETDPFAGQIGFALAMARVIVRRVVTARDWQSTFTVPAPGLAGSVPWTTAGAGIELASILHGMAEFISAQVLDSIADVEDRAELAEALMLAEAALHHEGLDTACESHRQTRQDPTPLQRAAWAELNAAFAA